MLLRLLARAVLTLYPKRSIFGLRVIFTDIEVSRERCVEQLESALVMLADHEPRWQAWMLRHVRHVIVWPGHYTSADRLGGFQVSSKFLSEASGLLLASVLIHEAVHVRIARHGITFESSRRKRIEKICVRHQADFLKRFSSEGAELAEFFETALESEWWTDEAHHEDLKRLVAERSLPPWMVWVLARGD